MMISLIGTSSSYLVAGMGASRNGVTVDASAADEKTL
jgi:hypothetical protein